jgi:hypothetical protein
VLKATDTGVSLKGATSKLDSMWHSPAFTSISPKRILVRGKERRGIRNFEIDFDLSSHCAHRTLNLIKYIVVHATDKINSADDRKHT